MSGFHQILLRLIESQITCQAYFPSYTITGFKSITASNLGITRSMTLFYLFFVYV